MIFKDNKLLFGMGTMVGSLAYDEKTQKDKVVVVWREINPIGAGSRIPDEHPILKSRNNEGAQWIFTDIKSIDIVLEVLKGARIILSGNKLPKSNDWIKFNKELP